MCGIAGVVHWDGRGLVPRVLHGMADTIVHRGPDAEGFYFNRGDAGAAAHGGRHTICRSSARTGGATVGLAHRRLSIIDLSTGQQPLSNEDGTVWVVFNGEIYNFGVLRNDLIRCGHRFKTKSDTEVIVHAYEEWGVECVRRFNGMFAFALWDERRESLFIARDRLGKKPLYYRATDDSFIFGSELKAVLAFPGLRTEIDATAVADYFKYLYVPDPKTIFQGISKLPPAHYLIADKGGRSTRDYWDVRIDGRAVGGEQELEEELFHLLEHAVRDRMVSEVPLGAFLSGGVDSSGVTALMARHSKEPVVTCSIGFDDPVHDESRNAANVARLLGTDHNEYVVRDGFLDTVRRLPAMFDEPFADASAVPTYFVCRMARQRVTVALSGDGGDETFAGYDKYVKDRIERLCGRWVPDLILRSLNHVGGSGTLARRIRTLSTQARSTPDRAFYRSNTFISDENLTKLLGPLRGQTAGYDPFGYIANVFNKADTDDHLTRMLYTDLKTYLPGDILVKVDRTSMANSLEVRAPLLDYRVVEFAANLPSRLKIRWGSKKYLLKQAFSRVLPPEMFRRPKHGFTVPLDAWFRSELVPLAEQTFFRAPQTAEVLDVAHVRRLWDEHRSGGAQHGHLLWATLMFSLWYLDRQRVPETRYAAEAGRG